MRKKVETTYLSLVWGVLARSKVRSWSLYLKHQWSQINAFAFWNNIHHHTYFKNPYVHMQMFHILHNYTWNCCNHFSHFRLGDYCRKSAAKTDLLRPWLWTLTFDVGYHNPPNLKMSSSFGLFLSRFLNGYYLTSPQIVYYIWSYRPPIQARSVLLER